MALNLKNEEVEALATEVAAFTGETKTEAIRQALLERRARLKMPSAAARKRRVLDFLSEKIWPHVPLEMQGRRFTRAERDDLLGYGPGGV